MNFRAALVGFLAVSVLVALSACGGGSGGGGEGGGGDRYDLQIITPHNDNIQIEFERGFVEHVGKPLRIRWIKKGTREIIQQLEAQDRAEPGASFGFDVFFGGGAPDHDIAAESGYLAQPDLPDEILAGVPAEIAGVPNYDEERLWYGNALSSFGVLMNLRGLKSNGLPEIRRWEDLAKPEMYSWVVVADARKSSSVGVCYELILQQYGWERGLPMLLSIMANSRDITNSSSAIPNAIASGDVLAGPCIDFYAYARVNAAGQDVLKYVNPTGGSAITPDPIAMLRNPPNRDLAEAFIAYVLSPKGQALWVLPPGAEAGPEEHALFRMPVRPDVFDTYGDQITMANPYKEAEAGTFRKMDAQLQASRNELVAELLGAAVVDQHSNAKAAWKALIDGGMKPAAVAEWNKLPFEESEISKHVETLAAGGRELKMLTRDWTQWFQAKYERVKELAQ